MLVVAKWARRTDDRILHGTLHGTPGIHIVVCLVQLNCTKKQKERVSLTDQKTTSKTWWLKNLILSDNLCHTPWTSTICNHMYVFGAILKATSMVTLFNQLLVKMDSKNDWTVRFSCSVIDPQNSTIWCFGQGRIKHSLGIQSPCQMMIGVYNQLLHARYLGSITILSFGAWIPRDSFLCLACYFFQLNISNRTSLNPCHVFDAMGASCSEADIFRVTKVGVEWTVRSIEKVSLKRS